jgi:hypothetical protein
MQRLRPLTEEECYLRCYGSRDDDLVRVVREAEVVHEEVAVLTERIRLAFEAGLEPGEAEAA